MGDGLNPAGRFPSPPVGEGKSSVSADIHVILHHLAGPLGQGEISLNFAKETKGVSHKGSMGFDKSISLTEKKTTGRGVRTKDAVPSVLETDEPELVKRARNDDPWAMDQLLKRYYQKAYGIAYRMCSGDEEEARDLVQDAFLNAFRNLKRFKGDSGFYTWLYRIVVNTCLDARRRRQRRSGLLSRWLQRKKVGRGTDQALEDRFAAV